MTWALNRRADEIGHVEAFDPAIRAHLLCELSQYIDVVADCSYVTKVRFEWDEAKRKENLLKHGVDFDDVPPLFDGITVTVIDDRFDYGEHRFITVGVVHGVVLTVAHTETDELIRIISARKATGNEEEGYFRQIRD